MTVKKVKSVIGGEATLADILDLIDGLPEEDLRYVLDSIPPPMLEQLWDYVKPDHSETRPAPSSPMLQAQELDAGYKTRPHLKHLSDRLSAAVKDVENGKSRFIVVSMPPRSGKSHLCSINFPTWTLRKHPEWKLGLISYSPTLASMWGRTIRELIKENQEKLGISIASDAGAVTEWQTNKRGGVVSRSAPGQSVTGLGFKVMIIDDIVKDFADAHSSLKRDAIWNWWLANGRTRLEPPSLVVVIGTRWHQDDFIGRLLSDEYDGDPSEWEVIEFPALAETDDVLGRTPGQPLYSPLMDETEEEALKRWEDIKKGSGTYAWTSLYQQKPSPSKGAIFDVDWWRFWTKNKAIASRDDSGDIDPNGRVVYQDPDTDLAKARWLDSWDCAFKATDSSDFVVGQRWAQVKARRYLVFQHRARMTFTKTLAKMLEWADPSSLAAPYSQRVHERLVEDKANGTAIIDMMKETVPGLIPINPTESKEARARAITPDVESGSVFLPYPGDPGNEWVQDLLSEFREFPTGAHDDQVDAGTQALSRMRAPQRGSVANPGRITTISNKRRGQVALSQNRRINR